MTSKSTNRITPEEIRSIRKKLGLSQVEAGEFIGGGPRAFTKYEAGTVSPSASAIRLLRILDADPSALVHLTGKTLPPYSPTNPSPFDVTGKHFARIDEYALPRLLRRLLNAEAHTHDLPLDGIHVASGIHVPDGGEDGRIFWEGGPERTAFLPSRLDQFQLKTGKVSPRTLESEVLTKNGAVKDMIRDVLVDGGNYIILCTHPYTFQEIQKRKNGILKSLRSAGVDVEDHQIGFRDADQIADWVNYHPAVAAWVLERAQPGIRNPFRSWQHWSRRTEHASSPWVEDERLPRLRARLIGVAQEPRRILRIVGLSGVGKSRLTLEALSSGKEEGTFFASDIVMYAVQSEMGDESINGVVQNLVDSGLRAVVVVDECDFQTHRVLSGMVLREESRLSLITIDDDVPSGTLGESFIQLDEAPDKVTEGIIDRDLPSIEFENQRRLAKFCRGFPEIAILVAEAWRSNIPIPYLTSNEIVEAFILGSKSVEPDLLRKTAKLIATFGSVGIKGEVAGQLEEVALFGRNISEEDMRASMRSLISRGVCRRRGRFLVLQPRPIAMRLAESQWEEWGPEKWDCVLAGNTNPSLKAFAARQLALLNTTTISGKVARHVCRYNGPFDGPGSIFKDGNGEVLSALAEIDCQTVAEQIGRCLDDVGDLTRVEGSARSRLVDASAKIAFNSDTFAEGANLLLRLAAAENQNWANNSTGHFRSLFGVVGASTEADGPARLSFLDEALEREDSTEIPVIAGALGTGSFTYHFTRMLGPEAHGSSKALEPWHPKTWGEATEYIAGCVDRLSEIAKRDGEIGEVARKELGQNLRPLITREGLIDEVESAVNAVTGTGRYWPEGLESLSALLAHDVSRLDSQTAERVENLCEILKPKSLEARLRSSVTDYLKDYTNEKRLSYTDLLNQRVKEARELAAEMVVNPEVLTRCLPQLSQGSQSMAGAFGRGLAESADSPLDWLEPIVESVLGVPRRNRNYALLSGFVSGLKARHPASVETFKERVAKSNELASGLPEICESVGVCSSDIPIVIGALHRKFLTPGDLRVWRSGYAISSVPSDDMMPLFQALTDHSGEGFQEAIYLLWWYASQAPRKLEGLECLVIRLAENVSRWKSPSTWNHCELEFSDVMDWMLRKGRRNQDACSTALALAKSTVAGGYPYFGMLSLVKPLMPRLLSDFPEVVWPIVGQAIVSGRQESDVLGFALSDSFSFAEEPNSLILNLPEHTLFAWCHAHPDSAPAFAARVIPVLTTLKLEAKERRLHPIMARLIDEFGESKNVQRAIETNIHNYSWTGSTSVYFAMLKEAFSTLLKHPKPQVVRWVRRVLRLLDKEITRTHDHDEETRISSEI